MKGFEPCLKFTLSWEGGYSDHPNDRGGATNFGITQQVYNNWLKQQDRPNRPVIAINRDEVEAIYRLRYWELIGGDKLPPYVNMVLFDYAVQSGPGRAVKALQRLIDTPTDGRVGAVTLAALAQVEAYQVARELLAERQKFLARIVDHDPTQHVFLRGWTNRIGALGNQIRIFHDQDLKDG